MTTSVNPQGKSALNEQADMNLAKGVFKKNQDYQNPRNPNILLVCINLRRTLRTSLSLSCVALCPLLLSKFKRLQILFCPAFDFALDVSGSSQGHRGFRPFQSWKFICISERPPSGPDSDTETLILSTDGSLQINSSAPKVDVRCDARNLASVFLCNITLLIYVISWTSISCTLRLWN
jgi:hypothetical protein